MLVFDRSLTKLNILFKLSGMNLKNNVVTLKNRWLYIFNFIWVISATIPTIYYVVIAVSNGTYFIELTSIAPCLAVAILAIFKSLFHLFNENNVSRLIEKLKELERNENGRTKSIHKEEIVNEEMYFLNVVINVVYILNCSMVVVFDLTPLVMIAIKYYKTKKFEMLLPYLDVFFFIPYDFKYWIFAYVHQIWSECIVLLEMCAADCLLFTCCTHIRVQFKMLQHDFETLIPANDMTSDLYKDPSFREKFNELVMWHQDLIDSSNILEIIYSKSTLLNFLSSSLVICLTGFNVTFVHDIIVIITFLTFLFMGLMQVFFLCLFADMLMRSSMEVSKAIYNCHWYSADIHIGKQMLIVQTRAQDPCKLTAAGFADVNLRAFMKVLSTAWSYFALLKTMYRR